MEKVMSRHAYTNRTLFLSRDDLHIYVKLYIPENTDGRMPAVILSHSASLNADSMHKYASDFVQRGYIACTFDFCGSGKKSRSDGNPENMTLFSQIRDLKAVIHAVSEMDITDADHIFLFGTSQGGLVTALTAEKYDTGIEGIILLYPAFNIPEIIRKTSVWRCISNISGSRAFCDTLQNYDVFRHIGRFRNRVLIIHGSLDFIVNSSWSQKAAECYDHCTLHIIKGAGHGFNRENYAVIKDFDDRVWEYIDAFLENP